MSVGTGSINRAARSGKKGTSSTEKAAATVPAVAAEVKSEASKKTTTKKTATKKTVQKNVGNECCQLTQELPIHLL